jgi:hypothetical protein
MGERSDRVLIAIAAALLFVLDAWPLLLVDVPPLQDLPNHMATGHVVRHIDLYPLYTFNGFLRSNSLLNTWLMAAGDAHLFAAARAFTALVIAANAIVLPWFVLHTAGRARVVPAMLLAWPLVHSFFVSMGFLNFAIALPASLGLIVLLDRQRATPTWLRGCAIAVLGLATWYAHPFPLAIVGGLVVWHVATRDTWPERRRAIVVLAAPLVPIILLVASTMLHHLIKAPGAPTSSSQFQFAMPWELPIRFWLDISGAFTRWGASTIVPAIALPIIAWRDRRADRSLLSWGATRWLLLAYACTPVMWSDWWYLNTRIAPYLWIALAVRVPPALPRRLVVALVASAVAFSVALGVDYVRLDRDRADFCAGISIVPEGAALLPLMFSHRRTSELTASLTHGHAFYVIEKNVISPMLFAGERSFVITYTSFPPKELILPEIHGFAILNGTPESGCDLEIAECEDRWRTKWASFWQLAAPRFNYVLTWAMHGRVRQLVPTSYHVVLERGDLVIFAREGGVTPLAAPP